MTVQYAACLCGDVPVTTNRKPNFFEPTYELWTVRREDWLPPLEKESVAE